LTQADGGDVAIDTSVPGQSTYYYSTQFLGRFRSRTSNGPNSWIGGVNFINPTLQPGGNPLQAGFPFVAPIATNSQNFQNPAQTRLVLGGNTAIFESFDGGANVRQLAGPGVTTNFRSSNAVVYGHPSNVDFIAIGTGNQVWVRTTPATPFPNADALTQTAANPPTPPGGFVIVSDIAADPASANVMFVTNTSTNTGASLVSQTTDGGATWTDITGNLASISPGDFRSLAYIEGAQNDILVVGAAGGAFASLEPFGCWFALGSGLPNTIGYDLDYDPTNDVLAIGMLGRGAWTLNGAANLVAPVVVTSPNGGELLLAGCEAVVTWTVGAGFENEILNILFSNDGGDTWIPLVTNTPNDGNDVVTLPCEETTEGRIMVEVSDKTFCDLSNNDFAVVFPSITVVGTVDNTFDPPDPWVEDGLVIDDFSISSDVDLFNVRFVADPLQCPNVDCEFGEVKKIPGNMVEFVPSVIGYLEAGQTANVEIKTTVPVGQHACDYMGQVHVVAEQECECPSINESFDIALEVLSQTDVDVADNDGNVSDNVLHLIGSKQDHLQGTFTVINPNSAVQNVDPEDGPGNIRIESVDVTVSNLLKIGDPGVVIPAANVSIDPLVSLASGEAQKVSLTLIVPDGIPVNAVYTGTVDVTYENCDNGDPVSDQFTLQLEVRETQGALAILATDLEDSFCPEDPWTMVGQVEFEFDIDALGDHRNVRLLSGGLEHETLDKKLDDFNFFPQEFALISAGETRTERIIVKIPIGQHSGVYSGFVRVVSESEGEDSVRVTIDICPIYDLDIKDHYANLSNNVMVIPAFSRANQSGGMWALRAFDIGLPSELVNNHDEFDGPSNTSVDRVTYEFGNWSTAWHEDDHDHDVHTNFVFTGTGSVEGDLTSMRPGEFRRVLVGVFVPPMKKNENHPGTYRGRLDCWAEVGPARVAHDFFDIEVALARVVGPGGLPVLTGTFAGGPLTTGAGLSWGDFSQLGINGAVNLYREIGNTGEYELVKAGLPQSSSYVDEDIGVDAVHNYKLGIRREGSEILIGPVSVGRTPKFVELHQNFPNPFRGQTVIPFDLSQNGHVSLKIYDVAGRLVRILLDDDDFAGRRSIGWDGKNQAGSRVASGVYYYRLVTPNRTAVRKLVIVR
jgi:hypothetical protein